MENEGLDSTKKIALPVDLIRTVAIVLVVLLHAANEALQVDAVGSPYWWTGAVYKTLSLSCVPLFIMLSGALLLQPSKFEEPIRVFLRKRLSRIGLAFFFWTAIYIIWGFFIYQFPLTAQNISDSILKSLFTGAYYQFWFIYLIVGLYLITPILRVLIANASDRIIRYLLLLWFVGVAVLPLVNLAAGFALDTTVFIIGGWVGYYILGTYLQKVKLQPKLLYGLLALSFAWTLIGVGLMVYPFAGLNLTYLFFDYLTANVIVGSVAVFLLLSKVRSDWPTSTHPNLQRLISAISKNTLPIFLFHLIIMESFQRGFFGFTLSINTLNPIVEIPLLATLTFFITLGLVLIMRRIPVLNKLIG
ncbi:MAG: acyltransferase family protein [Candidatus Bathyarchaeota archaeon]|nr:acyltransferase family protein [Candidatus Bathyarchaeota archaeon]